MMIGVHVIATAALPLLPGGRLNPQQMRQWTDAQQRGKKVRRAAGVARFQAWSITIFAVLTILLSGFDWPALLLGAGMGAAGIVQFWGAERLRRLEARSARLLGWNQLALGMMIVLYAVWGWLHAGNAPLPAELTTAAARQTLGPMIASVQDLVRTVMKLTYISIAVAAALGQGWAGWYYFSRQKYIRRYLEQTPQWVRQLQES